MQEFAQQNTNVRRKVLLVTRVSRSRRSSQSKPREDNLKLLWKTRTDNFERRKIYTVKILKMIKNLIKNVSVCDLHQLQCK